MVIHPKAFLLALTLIQSQATSSIAFSGDTKLFYRTNARDRFHRIAHVKRLPDSQQYLGITTDNTLLEKDNVLSVSSDGSGDKENHQQEFQLPQHLVSKLDIDTLLRHVSKYTCTKRGKDAVLSLLPTPVSSVLDLYLSKQRSKPSLFDKRPQKQRRGWYEKGEFLQSERRKPTTPTFPIAQSADEATTEYKLVYQAMEVFRSQSSINNKIPLPPMFLLRHSEPTDLNPQTDDDEWIDACINPLPVGADILEEIDLYMILQAEQITKLLLDTYEWAKMTKDIGSISSLSDIIISSMKYLDAEGKDDIDTDSVVTILMQLYESLRGAVEIIREGDSSYQFGLSSDRFRDLELLRQKEREATKKLNRTGTDSSEKAKTNKLAMIRDEKLVLEKHIHRTLIAAMTRAASNVDLAFEALARLDIVFAKAAFGLDWNGAIPEVGEEGRVNVHNFVHPILAIENKFKTENGSSSSPVTPIDLLIPGNNSYQALIISGPNAGGKTLSLKSFGLAATMVKLALPITVAPARDENVIVDFFQDIDAEIGDNQSILSGESTLMARLNALSSLIEKVESDSITRLVLLDELGGGTDPVAGAAIAQSILEKILSNPSCKIVATTHSIELKSLSLTNDKFQSACVMLSDQSASNDISKYSRKPTYELSYGITGESYALGAASRCQPPLPIGVIDRAAQLMTKDGATGDITLSNHIDALDRELLATKDARNDAERIHRELCLAKDDTITKLQASDIYLSRLERRLESIYETLRKDDKNVFELVGKSLDELKLIRKKVKSEEELLAEKGLRRVPDNYSFYDGETVVIISEGQFKGYNAVVKINEIEHSETDPSYSKVTVLPTLDLFSLEEEEPLLELRRTDIAIWDYPDSFNEPSGYVSPKYRRSNTSEKVINLLTTLNVDNKTTAKRNDQRDAPSDSFKSSRQRKASKKGKKKK